MSNKNWCMVCHVNYELLIHNHTRDKIKYPLLPMEQEYFHSQIMCILYSLDVHQKSDTHPEVLFRPNVIHLQNCPIHPRPAWETTCASRTTLLSKLVTGESPRKRQRTTSPTAVSEASTSSTATLTSALAQLI